MQKWCLLVFALSLWHHAWALSSAELLQLSRREPDEIIKLNDPDFQDVIGTNRDSYVLLLLTTTAPEFSCTTCLEFEIEYQNIVYSWFKDHRDGHSNTSPNISLFFAEATVAEASNIPDIFRFFQISQVPRLFLLPPGVSISSYSTIEISGNKGIERAAKIVSNVQHLIGINDMKIYEPIDWVSVILMAFLAFNVVFLFKRHTQLVIQLAQGSCGWAILCITIIIMMISGVMYNSIKSSTYTSFGSHGETIYFLRGELLNQFGAESRIIGGLYGILAILVVSLVAGLPKLCNQVYHNSDRGHFYFQLFSITGSFVLFAVFAAYTALFELKNPSYPYAISL